ncbi:Sensor histidine kinase [uncultured Candidatus Thioglobus sp.]|nr:Sensor histidine kinase [uncultured Candidatus Thioglobus sp.]
MVPQLLSALVHLYDRDSVLHQTIGADSADKISSIVTLLDSVDIQSRPAIINTINGYPLEISLGSYQQHTQHLMSENNQSLAQLFTQYLQRSLPVGYEAYVEIVESKPAPHIMGYKHNHPNIEMQSLNNNPQSALLIKSFHVQIELKDGMWVDFHYFLPKKIFEWPARLVIALLALMIGVLLLTWVAVRLVTKPLSTLSQAAEALGKNIKSPPLEVKGPTEVKLAATAFNTMQDRLVKFVGDRARILSAVSHDLKTPITRLRLRLELLDDKKLSNEIKGDLDHMEKMVNTTLDFMRGTEKHEPRQKVNLEALLESLQEDFRVLGMPFEVYGKVDKPLHIQLVSIKRCLTNLLENAYRYGNGEVSVEIQDHKETVEIVIYNNGDSIPDKDLDKIFEPFYRLEESRNNKTGGTGLGLSIARNIAIEHGGSLRIENASKGGISAYLILPK